MGEFIFYFIVFVMPLVIVIWITARGHIDKKRISSDKDIKSYMQLVNYEGGHESFTKPTMVGILAIKEGVLSYHDTRYEQQHFKINTNSIENIMYDTSEKITLSRMVVLGLASLVFKKKTYYLIIDYISDKGIKNKVIFNTGSIKNQEFFNMLNVERNNCTYKEKEFSSKNDNSINTNHKSKISPGTLAMLTFVIMIGIYLGVTVLKSYKTNTYENQYISIAKELALKHNLNDATISLEDIPPTKYHGDGCYYLKVKSSDLEHIEHEQKVDFVKAISEITVPESEFLVLKEIESTSYSYEINYDDEFLEKKLND